MMKEIIKSRFKEVNFTSYLADLLKLKYFEDEILIGISKQAIHQGVSSLSNKQLYRLANGLIDYYVYECDRCAINIPWEEMLDALDDGLCSYCRHIINKTMND